ncbi:MAG: hypothetical protein O2U61_02670 [Candidatus Bathyarchaeota archaeon]|nr:hypothetical protein [Candidatus Bathyarchaeota archaeon]
MRRNLLIFLTLFSISLVSLIAFDQVSAGVPGDPDTWEVGWPDLPGMPSPTQSTWPADEKLTLGYVITYIFTFALLIVGVVALLMLIISAVQYMASSAFPGGKVAALERIRGIGLGLLLLMGAYLLLSTINPELLIFGLDEAEMPEMIGALGSITLYIEAQPVDCVGNPATCCNASPDPVAMPGIEPDRELHLYSDPNLQDNPGWNDEATHFTVSPKLIARICSDRNYGNCTVYLDEAETCRDTTVEGFTPGAPAGVSSVTGLGTTESTRLILFEDTNQGGEAQVYSSDALACRTVAGAFTGDSYCLFRELGPPPPEDPPPQIYETILCRDKNWNNCSDEIGPGATSLTCANRPSITSFCIYERNPVFCVGALLTENNVNYDFVPYTQINCKNLTTTFNPPDEAIMVGDDCAVRVNDGVNCEGDFETAEGDDGQSPSLGGTGVSSMGGALRY